MKHGWKVDTMVSDPVDGGASRRLLAVFAHPDDEAFGVGGTLAHYAAMGVEVTLVCATLGEAGESSDRTLATPENLAEVREAELRCSVATLGIGELITLGYRDSGMADSPDNEHPHAFINAPAEEVIVRLVGILRRVCPQVVVTFDPTGVYGHPDHVAIHRHTVAAFHAAADPARYPDQGSAWQPARLFYVAVPYSFFKELSRRMAELGADPNEFAQFEDGRFGCPDDEVHVTMDVMDAMEAKWAALACHRTQIGSDHFLRRLPESEMKQMWRWEYFSQAWPQPSPDVHLTDLFAAFPSDGGSPLLRPER